MMLLLPLDLERRDFDAFEDPDTREDRDARDAPERTDIASSCM